MENEIMTISELPDDLLLKILSCIPSSKDVVATSLLSKRWRSLWKEVRTFKYGFEFPYGSVYHEFILFTRRIRRSKVESLELRLEPSLMCTNLNILPKNIVGHSLRKLRIEMVYTSLEFPYSFYISSQLETLILEKLSLVDVPSNVSLTCLKRLHLLSVRFKGDNSVATLLSICPRLEDLVVRRSSYTHVKIFTIDVPTLRALSIDNTARRSRPKGDHGFVINAPSLRSFSIRDNFSNYLRFADMHELVKARIHIVYDQPKDEFLPTLASAKYLSLCHVTTSRSPCTASFHFLEHLELCTCSVEWWNLLTVILNDAPRLRVLKLKLFQKHCVKYEMDMTWSQPSSVPECLASHLEIFEWRQYKGTKLEREVAKYILENAKHLEKASFYSEVKGTLKE